MPCEHILPNLQGGRAVSGCSSDTHEHYTAGPRERLLVMKISNNVRLVRHIWDGTKTIKSIQRQHFLLWLILFFFSSHFFFCHYSFLTPCLGWWNAVMQPLTLHIHIFQPKFLLPLILLMNKWSELVVTIMEVVTTMMWTLLYSQGEDKTLLHSSPMPRVLAAVSATRRVPALPSLDSTWNMFKFNHFLHSTPADHYSLTRKYTHSPWGWSRGIFLFQL